MVAGLFAADFFFFIYLSCKQSIKVFRYHLMDTFVFEEIPICARSIFFKFYEIRFMIRFCGGLDLGKPSEAV